MAVAPKQILYLGVPQSGKTTSAKTQLATDLEATCYEAHDDSGNTVWVYPPVTIYDPYDEFETIAGLDLPIDCGEGPFRRYTELPPAMHDARKRGGIFVLEEMLTLDQADFKELRKLSSGRRHLGLKILACTQRPAHIPVAYVALSDEVEVHRLVDPRDIKKVEHLLTPDQRRQLPGLEAGEKFVVAGN